MTRILSADLLIADVVIPLDGNAQLWPLIDKQAMRPGDKRALDDDQMKEFTAALEGVAATAVPGGSSANMLTTLAKILGKDIEIRFLGVAGEGQYSAMIKTAFSEAGITLMPERFPPCHAMMQSGVSYVFIYPDGQCTIATYAGNAQDILKPAMLAEHLVKNSDVVLVQGSLWRKFKPEFISRLLTLCERHQRELWLTLPTQLDVTKKEIDKFMDLIPSASLVFGNDSELMRVYGLPLNQSLQHLQKALMKHKRPSGKAIGFITFGKEGAAIITESSIDRVAPVALEEIDILNTLGAGDTAYAGFAAGYLKKCSNDVCAQIAMTLASEKLRVNGSRLPDPKTSLNTVAPDLAQMLRN